MHQSNAISDTVYQSSATPSTGDMSSSRVIISDISVDTGGQPSLSASVHLSSIMREINSLKSELSDIKKVVAHIEGRHNPPNNPPNYCHVRVRFPHLDPTCVDSSVISNLLSCPVHTVTKIGDRTKLKFIKNACIKL